MFVVVVELVAVQQPGGEAHEGAYGVQLTQRARARVRVHPREALRRRRERRAHVFDHLYGLRKQGLAGSTES